MEGDEPPISSRCWSLPVRRVQQHLIFPSWKVPWKKLAVVVWADASNSNRPDKSSTMGILSGVAPEGILGGEEHVVALVQWRSSKTPRQVLGSNGAEVQAITEGEDTCFRLRALLAEVNGVKIERRGLYEMVRNHTKGALVMDSKGIYDAMVRNASALHGLRSGRGGYELTLAVGQAREIDTALRWVNGDAQLGDCLTKSGSRKVILQFMACGQRWKLVHDEEFTAGKKPRKRDLESRLAENEQRFINLVKEMAEKHRWPWKVNELRNGVDVITETESAVGDMVMPHEFIHS